jgi:hypothetical protein
MKRQVSAGDHDGGYLLVAASRLTLAVLMLDIVTHGR